MMQASDISLRRSYAVVPVEEHLCLVVALPVRVALVVERSDVHPLTAAGPTLDHEGRLHALGDFGFDIKHHVRLVIGPGLLQAVGESGIHSNRFIEAEVGPGGGEDFAAV